MRCISSDELRLPPVRLVLVTVMVITCGGGHSSLFLFPKRSLIVIKPLPKRQWWWFNIELELERLNA
jgi:hypothetical protein